ncbi:hypothetical protein BDN67DRAFT_971484 [Paxillus ammoniavirescens]|nr:hypothetical protein BDN67DRAFT_971484 [Paxillus ammoniavirescens]
MPSILDKKIRGVLKQGVDLRPSYPPTMPSVYIALIMMIMLLIVRRFPRFQLRVHRRTDIRDHEPVRSMKSFGRKRPMTTLDAGYTSKV